VDEVWLKLDLQNGHQEAVLAFGELAILHQKA
jgi:hypothetical protein